jgi:hypothetical protein
MKTARQTYLDGTLQDAIRAHCDCLQLKFDGWMFVNGKITKPGDVLIHNGLVASTLRPHAKT